MLQFTKLLAIASSVIFNDQQATLSCLDKDNKPIEWFFSYRLPDKSDMSKKFLYYDNKSSA